MNNKLVTKTERIIKFNNIHGENRYNYELVPENFGSKMKIPIICEKTHENGSKHGIFLQRTDCHQKGQGCSKCYGNEKSDKEKFIKKALTIKKHKDKNYNYDNFIYKGHKTKGEIFCPKNGHGLFLQTPGHHLEGVGCPKCANESIGEFFRLTKDDVIKRAFEIHKNDYDYSLILEYRLIGIKLPIKCNKCNVIFWQSAKSHTTDKHGCPTCSESKGEKTIRHFLIKNNINFIRQKKFNDCISCNSNRKLSFDFYLPELNLCIEYDGEQHFKSIEYFGGENTFKTIQNNDNIKTNYCFNNNIKLIRIKYTENVEDKLNAELKLIYL